MLSHSSLPPKITDRSGSRGYLRSVTGMVGSLLEVGSEELLVREDELVLDRGSGVGGVLVW